MDSQQWHGQASAIPEPSPTPWSAAELRGADVPTREAYASQVRRWLRATPLDSPKHHDVADALGRALADTREEPPGARTLLSLSAPFAVGKSSLIKSWAQARHREWLGEAATHTEPSWTPTPHQDADWVPVVYVTLMARSNARDLYAAILAFLRHPSRGANRDITLRATKALATHGVQLLVVDDAHMLNTSSVTGRATLDALKQLNTELGELGGTIVLVGAHLSGGAALADPQIRGRLREHHLDPYQLSTSDQTRQWQHLLGAAEARLRPYLPDLTPGALPRDLGRVIYKRTQGFVGDTSTLLAGATAQALRNGRTVITRADIADVPLSQRAHDGETALDQPNPSRQDIAS